MFTGVVLTQMNDPSPLIGVSFHSQFGRDRYIANVTLNSSRVFNLASLHVLYVRGDMTWISNMIILQRIGINVMNRTA